MPENSLEPEEFSKKFTRFLYGSVGSKHRLLLGFEDGLTCGEPAPKMTVRTCCSKITPYITARSASIANNALLGVDDVN